MKKQSVYKLVLSAIILTVALSSSFAQNFEAVKTINKVANVPNQVTVDISNHSGNIDFITNSDEQVTIDTQIKVNARSQEDAQKLIKAIEDFTFKKNGNTLIIDTRFYKNRQTINGKSTITLEDGSKIKIRDFEISHKISLPKTANLKLENKYSNISMESLNGKLSLKLYNSKVIGKSMQNNAQINAKYSNLSFQKFAHDVDLTLYDSDIKFYNCGNLKINSKYSKVEVEKMDKVTADSYDDKYFLDEMNDLVLTGKYSDIKIRIGASTSKMNLYDCDVYLEHTNNLAFSGRYCELKMGLKNLSIDDSYDNDFHLYKVQNVNINRSKYSKFLVDWCSYLSIQDSYDDEIKISNLNDNFSGIKITGKYTKINVDKNSMPVKIDAKMKYGKVSIPESVKITKHIDKNSDLEMLAGENGETIFLRGYDNTLLVK